MVRSRPQLPPPHTRCPPGQLQSAMKGPAPTPRSYVSNCRARVPGTASSHQDRTTNNHPHTPSNQGNSNDVLATRAARRSASSERHSRNSTTSKRGWIGPIHSVDPKSSTAIPWLGLLEPPLFPPSRERGHRTGTSGRLFRKIAKTELFRKEEN